MASRQFTINLSAAQSPREFGPMAIPDRFDQLEFRFGNWAQANRTLAVQFFVSTDGEATWQSLGAMNPTPGARGVGRDGTTDASVVLSLPNTQNVSVKASATAAGGVVSSLLTITAT